MKKRLFEAAASKGIIWIMIIVMTFLTVVSLFFRSYIDVTYQEIIYYRRDNAFLTLSCFVLSVFLIYMGIRKKILEKIPERPLFIAMMIFVAAVSGLWAYFSYSVPTADQKSILECAEGLMNGNYECMTYKGYLQYNRHQVGITAFYELFFKIFNRGKVVYRAVYVMNTAMIAGIFFVLYLITKELTKRKEAVITELLLSFGMFQLMLYSNFVYGLIPGLLFALTAILFMLKLLKTSKWYYGVLMSLCMALAVVMKSNYLIFVAAVSIILAVKAISRKKWMYFLYIILIIVGFTGMNTAAQKTYEIRTGMEFGDTIPNSAYVAMGMQESAMAPGWFNGFNHVTYRENGYNAKVTDQIAKEYISERIGEFAEEPLECLKFYYYKIVSQWNEVTYESFWVSNHSGEHSRELSPLMKNLYTGSLHTIAEAVMNLYQFVMFAGTLCLTWNLRKKNDISKTILLLCVLGGFLFHILWEGKSQYIISYFPLMLPCAAMGLCSIGQSGEKNV